MLCWPSWLRIMILLNGFLLAHQILFQRTEKRGKKPYNCFRIGIWWSFNILTFRVFMLNPSPCCLSWRKLSAISHKDVSGWRTQLTLCLLITSLDLSQGRGSEVKVWQAVVAWPIRLKYHCMRINLSQTDLPNTIKKAGINHADRNKAPIQALLNLCHTWTNSKHTCVYGYILLLYYW